MASAERRPSTAEITRSLAIEVSVHPLRAPILGAAFLDDDSDGVQQGLPVKGFWQEWNIHRGIGRVPGDCEYFERVAALPELRDYVPAVEMRQMNIDHEEIDRGIKPLHGLQSGPRLDDSVPRALEGCGDQAPYWRLVFDKQDGFGRRSHSNPVCTTM